jgi:hypothetical protein
MLSQSNEDSANNYKSGWETYRRRRNRIVLYMVAEFLAFIPFVGLVATVGRLLFATNNLAMPAAWIWGVLYLYTISRLRSFPCPRCGQNFFGGFFAIPGVVLGNKCANCGLRKWAGDGG